MIKNIIKKHAIISMSNGNILEGFVLNSDGTFLELIETNNNKVIVRIDHISFARMSNYQEEYIRCIYQIIEQTSRNLCKSG